jgi:hypothetical protein
MPKKETDERIATALERIAASLDELNRHAERLNEALAKRKGWEGSSHE